MLIRDGFQTVFAFVEGQGWRTPDTSTLKRQGAFLRSSVQRMRKDSKRKR